MRFPITIATRYLIKRFALGVKVSIGLSNSTVVAGKLNIPAANCAERKCNTPRANEEMRLRILAA